MGEIIPFPKSKPRKTKSNAWQVERVNTCASQPAQTFDFTCVTCKNKTRLELKNAVLKNMDLYCDKCGTGWRVTNPVFSVKRDAGT
jgi:hypothetical protein